MKHISICIPTYEFDGKGTWFLKRLFKSIQEQTFQSYEIIISDHSSDNNIELFCNKGSDLNIKYYRNTHNRGSIASNTNFAIDQANGEIIKIIYQDDFFIHQNALKLIIDYFDFNNTMWLAHGFAHSKKQWFGWKTYKPMIPTWTENLLIGENLLGSPSCIAFRNKSKLLLDENLQLLVDVEWYYRMKLKLGLPGIIPEILISNREHKKRTSTSGINYNYNFAKENSNWGVDKKELDYVLEKHKKTFTFRDH